jgi:hypothetical protein
MPEETAVLQGLKPGMEKKWKGMVEDALEFPEGGDRQGAVLKIAQIGVLINALGQGQAPAEVIRLLDPKVDLVLAVDVVRDVCALSVRGEEFRLWWNAWHDRVHDDDKAVVAGRESRREIFNPGLICFNGKPVQIMAKFDPATPLTKRKDYGEIVKNAIRSAGLSVKG